MFRMMNKTEDFMTFNVTETRLKYRIYPRELRKNRLYYKASEKSAENFFS